MSNLEQFPSERGFSDRYGVDRSLYTAASQVLATLPQQWVRLGGQRESTNVRIRQDITMQEKLDAWRELCALPDAKRVESFWE